MLNGLNVELSFVIKINSAVEFEAFLGYISSEICTVFGEGVDDSLPSSIIGFELVYVGDSSVGGPLRFILSHRVAFSSAVYGLSFSGDEYAIGGIDVLLFSCTLGVVVSVFSTDSSGGACPNIALNREDSEELLFSCLLKMPL
mgnify:CR=1 FL=1